MESFESNCREIILLSNILLQQKFRSCFVEYILEKTKVLIEMGFREKVNINIGRKLQLKLIEPVILHLRVVEKSTDKYLLIQYLIYVLKLSLINSIQTFFHLYHLLFSQIFDNGNMKYQNSEELKMIVLKAGSCLIHNSEQKILEEIFRPESGEKFSTGIYIAVRIAKEERSIKLRLEALDFLLVASQFKEQVNYNEGIYKNLGDLFMLYLPGVIAPLQEIILRDETQHHLITLKALKCWGHILCLVLSDCSYQEQPTEDEIIKQWMNFAEKPSNKEKEIDISGPLTEKKRTKNWLTAASIRLKPLIMKITEVRKHSNAKCRIEITKIMVKLLKNCAINLEASLTPIVDVVVGSAYDESKEVCYAAEEALKMFEVACEKKKHKTFISVIQSNWYSLLCKLPGIFHSGNEKLILLSLKSFSGYTRILGKSNELQKLLSLSSTLKKLLFVFQISFELQLHQEISNQEISFWEYNTNSNFWFKKWKQFKHFADEKIINELEQICQLFGKYSDEDTVFDYLIDVYFEENTFSRENEILLILNQVILGAKKIKDYIIDELLNFYLNSNKTCVPLEVGEDNSVNMRKAYSNIVKVALTMEGIGNLAIKLGTQFEGYLLQSLYYVLEHMGSTYSIINAEATKTAIAISSACGLNGSVESLIRKNFDYLMYHSIIKLKRNNSDALGVVTVLLKTIEIDTVNSVEEIVNNVLNISSKNLNSPLTISYLRLFQTYVRCVRESLQTSNSLQLEFSEKNDFEEFLNTIKRWEVHDLNENEEKSDSGEDEKFVEVDEHHQISETLPKHVKITVDLSNHCLHFLASKDRNKKIIVLEILNDSVLILSKWENELLPLVHKIWSPLVTRFDQMAEPLIIRTSFTLLCTLAQTSKQFIRSRTLKNVLPTLQCFLVKEAHKSKLKDSSSGYYFTQNFKLQRELLENLGPLTTNLELFERQTDLVVESSLHYLSALQPKELQEKCLKLFCHLKIYDPYLVWFKLKDLAMNPEFEKNVEIILSST